MQFTPEDISLFIGLSVSVWGMYGRFKAEVVAQEKRLVVLEKDRDYLRDFKESAIKRLDNHDEQNKAILVLAEQVRTLSEDLKEIKSIVTKLEETK